MTMMWLEIDQDGTLLGIYSADTIPPSLSQVDVPDDYPEFQKWDSVTQTFVEDLSALNTELLAKIDAEAGAFRQRFITDIAGQETTYRLKEDEANAWDEATSDPADFPYLDEEAAAKGITISTLAADIVATAARWRVLNPKIEGARTAAKVAVLAAADVAGKQAAAVVDWEALLL